MTKGFPSEFFHEPQAIHEISYWKATEHRNFLLYTVMVALNEIVDDEIYKHFLLLVCGRRTLVNPHLC